jgi:hypothetical protein
MPRPQKRWRSQPAYAVDCAPKQKYADVASANHRANADDTASGTIAMLCSPHGKKLASIHRSLKAQKSAGRRGGGCGAFLGWARRHRFTDGHRRVCIIAQLLASNIRKATTPSRNKPLTVDGGSCRHCAHWRNGCCTRKHRIRIWGSGVRISPGALSNSRKYKSYWLKFSQRLI